MGYLEAGVGDAEVVDPVDFRKEADHLAEGVGNAEQQHQSDEAVEARVVHEGRPYGREEHRHEDGNHQYEHHHADQIDPRQVDRDLIATLHSRNQHASTLSRLIHIKAKILEGKDVAKRCHKERLM